MNASTVCANATIGYAGDLDEAVQALKATTVACQPRNTLNSRHSDCNSPPDDDLKPAFMRHAPAEHSPVLYNTLSASAGTHSSFAPAQAVTAGNGARLSARHHGDPTVRASAKEVLQARLSLMHARADAAYFWPLQSE